MAIQLEPKEKRWLKRVYLYLTNIDSPSSNNWDVQTFNSTAKGFMQLEPNADVNAAWEAAQNIKDTILEREYKDIDDEIDILASDTRYWDKDKDDYLKLSATEISDTLAGMCVLNGIEWDPTEYTDFEVNEFNKTMFGKSLKFAWELQTKGANGPSSIAPKTPKQSAQSTKPAQPAQSTQTTGTPYNVPIAGNYINGKSSVHTRSTQVKYNNVPVDPNDPSKGTMQVKATPKDNYKNEGPKSGLCRDLKSTPGNKIYLTGEQGYVFVIVAEDNKDSSNLPYLFVTPLKDTKTYKVGNTNRVIMGSAHWYGDLKLFFNTHAEAQAFMTKALNANIISTSKFTNVHIEAKALSSGRDAKFLSHGFYEIGTELGNAYVCAYRLNEELDEPTNDTVELDEAAQRKARMAELWNSIPW